MIMCTRSVLTVVLAAWTCIIGFAHAETAQSNLQEQWSERFSWTSSFLQDVVFGNSLPAGVNRWDCVPAEGKSHVILVHGTFSSAALSFGALAPKLQNAGYCVYALNYGEEKPGVWFKGTAPVDRSAAELARFVDEVQRNTGAAKVDLMGHSQGGLIGFYYLKKLQGAQHVNQFIALAPSVRGTDLSRSPLRSQVPGCPACADQHPRSKIIETLHQDSPLAEGVRYTVVVTANDKVVVPVEKQFIRLPQVNNVLIQDVYPDKSVSHSRMLYDTDCLNLMLDALAGKPTQRAEATQALNGL